MDPTLEDGQHVIMNKVAYLRIDMWRLARLVPFWDVEAGDKRYLPFAGAPGRGDVIVFKDPNQPGRNLVKRIVGLPGETVEITEGAISIDGVRLDEPYLTGAHWSGSMRCVPHRRGCILGDDQYFVMGDNRGNSDDSRRWGPVSLADIVGRVWVTY